MSTDIQPSVNPFPGLRPFEFGESNVFFGRDDQSLQLVSKLRQTRFVTILGVSGSGKSSIVRAGLLPTLLGSLLSGAGNSWRVVMMRPGYDPIGNLVSALNSNDVLGQASEDRGIQAAMMEATLRRSSLGLIELFRQARLPAEENVLIVVDQFEELFRFRMAGGETDEEATAFVKLLLEATHQREFPIYVVLTMRSDFLGDCSQFRDLPEMINVGQYLIPRLTRDEYRQAITGPVAVYGGKMTEAVINQLLNEIADNPDGLSLMQHVLSRTWSNWHLNHQDGEPIDVRHYNEIGGMDNALSRDANEAYDELPDNQREIAEKLFKALTERGRDNREVRRPIKVSEITAIAGADQKDVIEVIEVFRQAGRSFLMPPGFVAINSDSVIDISHESLIRGWDRLKRWVGEEARSAQVYRRLAETASLYQKGEAALWRDPDLQIVLNWYQETQPNESWAQRYHPNFAVAMQFLEESRRSNEFESLKRQELLVKGTRRSRLLVIAGFLALSIIILFLAFYANQQRKEVLRLMHATMEQR